MEEEPGNNGIMIYKINYYKLFDFKYPDPNYKMIWQVQLKNAAHVSNKSQNNNFGNFKNVLRKEQGTDVQQQRQDGRRMNNSIHSACSRKMWNIWKKPTWAASAAGRIENSLSVSRSLTPVCVSAQPRTSEASLISPNYNKR